MSAIEVLDSFYTKSKLVYEGYIALNKLARAGPLFMLWVPGHSKIRGNKVADRLASQASREHCIGPGPMTEPID